MTPQRQSVGRIKTRTAPALNEMPKQAEGPVLKFLPLGGCGEVTRSCYVYEYKDDIVIVDMGLQFPEEDMPGIDYIIPNVEYLIPKRKNIRGVIVTHGHLDHIGAIPHLLEPLGNPVIYTKPLTRGMILKRQEDFRGTPHPKVELVDENTKLKLGCFDVEFFHVNHNIPDSMGVVLRSPAGTVVHTGDWKFDHTPVNERPADVERLKQIGKDNVLLLVADSTGSQSPGKTISESEIQKNLDEIFTKAKGRIIAATFSSLLTRVQQLIWLAEKYDRKVLIEGTSMKQNVQVAQELGYLKIKKGTVIGREDLAHTPKEKIIVVCTGAQGEDRAALMRIANGEHKYLHLENTDSVIFSSSVVPGNEASVQRLKDILYKKAEKIFHSESMDIHASGHAKGDDLKEMIQLIKPKYFIPMHGNYFMLKLHSDLAIDAGIKKENAVIAEDGEIIVMDKNAIRKSGQKAPVNLIMVDGLGVGDVKEVVLRDRQMLAEDGIFVIISVVDSETGKVKGSPDIISRGFVYLRESRDLLSQARHLIRKVIEESTSQMHPINWTFLKDELREELGKFLFRKTERRPMVLPVIIEV
ncbi:ribonuclease J [Candidatus Giovannonibacteria bacterium]|nr:ribonuclease J [Candidatus Giovannonibacteria bacterium]